MRRIHLVAQRNERMLERVLGPPLCVKQRQRYGTIRPDALQVDAREKAHRGRALRVLVAAVDGELVDLALEARLRRERGGVGEGVRWVARRSCRSSCA